MKANPTTKQLAFVNSLNLTRNTSQKEYEEVIREVRLIPIKSPKSFPGTRKGSSKNELKLSEGFKPHFIPLGWALVPMYDSGGNHLIENAGVALIREAWNKRK